ncbi:MAG: ATP-grasp domain-containing protein [Prevotella sp.]|nr:ATP-grasp domain-containing protein [Prevotella sp.]
MKKDTTVVILGGTRPHAELIKYLHSKGHRTVLIDYLDNPPAKSVADVHYQESSLDVEAVERIAKKENACYIMDICTDRAIPPAALVAEKLHLPHPYSYETSLIATNKNKMKSFLQKSNIPTSKFFKIATVGQASSICLEYPIIVKPSDASGSIGITKVDNFTSLKPALEYALQMSRNGQAVVEEYVDGTEIQMDCFVSDSHVYILDIKEKRKYPVKKLTLSYGSLIPARISERQRNRCIDICNRIAQNLNILNGPLYVQAIANNQNVYVIEFGLRFGGNLSFRILKDVSGVDIVSSSADAYMGNEVKLSPKGLSDEVYTTYHVFPRKGVFKIITGYEHLLENKTLEAFHVNKQSGITCEGNMTSKERLASFIIRAKDIEENNRKLRKVLDFVEVWDVLGNPIMRKDIYEL